MLQSCSSLPSSSPALIGEADRRFGMIRSTMLATMILFGMGPSATPAVAGWPSSEAEAVEIASFTVERQGSTTEIGLLGISGDRRGTVRVRTGETAEYGHDAILIEGGAALYSVAWDSQKGLIRIRDLSNGETGHAFFDLQEFAWVRGEAFRDLMERQGPTFMLIASVMGELEVRGESSFKERADLCALRSDSRNLAPKYHGEITCSGEFCRGFSTGTSRSICCYEANQDLHLCCWNFWCIGCCQTLACDAGCGLGDYLCFCGQSGRSCVVH